MGFVRSIGRWTMTALVINCIIGSGIFGVPAELTRLVGRASPIAMLISGLAMFSIMACYAEVGSQFTEPGGTYLYVRTAFGRLAGLQVGWFWLLSAIGAGAANATLFVQYLGGFFPGVSHGVIRVLIITAVIAFPATVNYFGVRQGARLSTLFTIAKLTPLALLIVVGIVRFSHQAQLIHSSEMTTPGIGNWLTAFLMLSFCYGGFEDAVVPTGEVRDPRRTLPFALVTGLLTCMVVYTALQFIVVATIGNQPSQHPLAQSATVLLGPQGGVIVTVAVLFSTYGWISACVLNAPRLPCAFALHGDAPEFLGRLHPRFKTPAIPTIVLALLVWLLAVTGTFLWALAVTAGSMTVFYSAVCASLIRLRKLRPSTVAMRVPFGPVLALAGIVISLAALTRIGLREGLLMGVTAVIAFANWLWARRHQPGITGDTESVVTESRSHVA
jgi:basic amino acid/polyamine antiporter, APA family